MKLDFSHSLLLLIDIQNDFCPGGALAINEGDKIIQPLNLLSAKFKSRSGRVAATQDWHPPGHASFASTHGKNPYGTIDLPGVKAQVLWPDHCVEGTSGADFHKELDLNPVNLIIRKGFRPELDSYSAFFENDRTTPTGLDGFLRSLSIDTIIMGGLATDFCVFYSAMDALNLSYKTIIAVDTVRGVDLPAGSADEALEKIKSKGAILLESGEIE